MSEDMEIKFDFDFDNSDNGIIVLDEEFKNKLPAEHKNNLSKLFGKLSIAPFGEVFITPFNREETRITYAKLDYKEGIEFDRTFDNIDSLILNAIYSFYKDDNVFFTNRNILQHIFGNVSDHFKTDSELVEIVDQHLDKLRSMQISMDLKDKFGNDAAISRYGKKYRPIAIEENLLAVSIVKMKSVKNGKILNVYRINRISPIFKYAEKLKQITSWKTEYMKVPARKTIQNAILCSYLLTKISLVKNDSNKYRNNGVLFQTIFEDLKLDVSTRDKKMNIRGTIKQMFDFWLKIGLLTSYKFEKKGTQFYKISFTVKKNK